VVLVERAFDHELRSASEARRFVTSALADVGLNDLVDAASLLTSELVTNAYLHAASGVTVRVTVDAAAVLIEIRDESLRMPMRKRYGPDSTTGRGMLLVEQLSAQWGVTPEPGGKCVWFVLDPTSHRKNVEDLLTSAAASAAQALTDDVDLDELLAAFGDDQDEEFYGSGPTALLVRR
jgi:anti-sigma regulatory factor (Ser/Thr protein kinase)